MSQYPRLFNKFAIIPHPTSPKALLIDRDGSWTLPGLVNPVWDLNYQYVGAFNEAISALFGVEVTTLGYFRYTRSFSGGALEIDRFYVRENQCDVGRTSAGSHWLEETELESLRLGRSSVGPMMKEWFAWYYGQPDARQALWERPGWFGETEARIDEMLLRQTSHTRTGPIEQVVVWTRSCVLRVPTESGSFYFKTASKALGSETGLTIELAKRFPSNSVRSG